MRTIAVVLTGLLLATTVWPACTRSDLTPEIAARVSSPAARARGRRLFLTHCALCHGEDANGRGPRRSAFARPPRDFTDIAWRRSTSPRKVFDAIHNGVAGTAMPAWAVLGDDAIWDLTAFVLAASDAPSR